MKTFARLLVMLCAAVSAARAEVKFETIEYKQGDATLEGYLAYDDAVKGKRPGVLIVHQYRGMGGYEKKRAEMLAKLGYTAFACDIYGKGIHPSPKDAGVHMVKYTSNRMLLRARAQAGLDVLKKHATVDASRTAAIGYCSGGTAVLEMARANMDVRAVVSFHGQLRAQPGLEAKEKIKPIMLVCHGEADEGVGNVAVFKKEFLEGNAKADMTFITYPGVRHGFTIWNDNTTLAAGPNPKYDKHADEDSWKKMQEVFARAFKP
jgi:dienelactone hydrolase